MFDLPTSRCQQGTYLLNTLRHRTLKPATNQDRLGDGPAAEGAQTRQKTTKSTPASRAYVSRTRSLIVKLGEAMS